MYVASLTYSGQTFNTILNVEYQHTGKQWFYKKKGQRNETFTENPDIASEKIEQGLKVREQDGYYFISRISIPTINTKGENDFWYITNDGDSYKINRVSKYGRKVHNLLSNNIIP